MARAGGSAFGGRKFKHTKITPADPNSKNYARKQKKLKGTEGSIEKGAKTKNKRPELKTAVQITKERRLKEKRREKTGRHFLAKKKKKSRS
jgi:ATP-dependent RNA helicase DDX54/DBP10